MFEELKEEREKFAARIQSLQRARHESLARSFCSLQPQKSRSLSQFCSQITEPVSYNRNSSETRAINHFDLLTESTNGSGKVYEEQPIGVTAAPQNKVSSAVPSADIANSSTEVSCSPATYSAVRGRYKLSDNSGSFSNHSAVDVPNHLAVHDQRTRLTKDEEVSIAAAVHTPVTRHTEVVGHHAAKDIAATHRIDCQQATTHSSSKGVSQQHHDQVDKGTMTHSLRLKSVAIQVESKRTPSARAPTPSKRMSSQSKLTVSDFVYPVQKRQEIEYHPGAISNLVHPAYSSSVLQSYTEIYKSLSNTSKAILSN